LPPGFYQGTITISGFCCVPSLNNGATTNSVVIAVSLTVSASPQLPKIGSIVNAASFTNPYNTISPGEIVTIFGEAMGPPAALQLQLDSTGKVSTSLGNAQVLFSGYPAPLTYVSATQINCIVPYEIVGTSNPAVQVQYSGQSSNSVRLISAPTSPG